MGLGGRREGVGLHRDPSTGHQGTVAYDAAHFDEAALGGAGHRWLHRNVIASRPGGWLTGPA